jgi:hypothetical protein
MLKHILLSKYSGIVLLILSTFLDCGTTYATVKNKLYLDGNPIIRGLNWNQIIIIQLLMTIFVIVAFLLASRYQNKIMPKTSMKFIPFLVFFLKKQLYINFKNYKDDLIYSGLVMLWILTCAHFIAGILAIMPLLGGPSILSFMSMIGFNGLRQSQFVIIVFVALLSIIIGHYPIYLSYNRTIKDSR